MYSTAEHANADLAYLHKHDRRFDTIEFISLYVRPAFVTHCKNGDCDAYELHSNTVNVILTLKNLESQFLLNKR